MILILKVWYNIHMDKEQLVKRLKSFAWRLGAIVAVSALTFLADNIGLFGLPLQVQVVVGLIIGEITKWLNTGRQN